jgi:putative ABC transport system ATP-binding protein
MSPPVGGERAVRGKHAIGVHGEAPGFAQLPGQTVERYAERAGERLKCNAPDPTPRNRIVLAPTSIPSRTHSAPLIALRGVGKTYAAAAGPFHALTDVDVEIRRGEFVAIIGQSGSGKSTLLNVLAGIDRPSSGEVIIDGVAVHGLSERALSAWRGAAVGIVFQFFQLLPTLTAAENVMLPMDFCNRWPRGDRRKRALGLLDRVGIADQADKFPGALSGGQQQRVAVARALANAPPILLADEPTGNLDSRSAQALLQVLRDRVSEGETVILVTHDRSAIEQTARAVTLVDGRVVSDTSRAHA